MRTLARLLPLTTAFGAVLIFAPFAHASAASYYRWDSSRRSYEWYTPTATQNPPAATNSSPGFAGRISYDANGNAYWQAATTTPVTTHTPTTSVTPPRRTQPAPCPPVTTAPPTNKPPVQPPTQPTTQTSNGGGAGAGHYAYTSDGVAYWQPETTP